MTDMVPTDMTPSTDLEAWLEAANLPEESDADEVTREILLRILSATSVEQALSPPAVVKADDMIDEAFMVEGIMWRRGEQDDGNVSRFATMQAVNRDGERFVVNSGAKQVVVQLWVVEQLGGFPVWVRFRKLGNKRPGRSQPLGLELATDF
jgi:hypothetical protein